MDANIKIGSIVKQNPNARTLFLVFSLTVYRGTTKMYGDPKRVFAEVLRIDTPIGKKCVEWTLTHERGIDTAPWSRTTMKPFMKKWHFKRLDKAVVVSHVDDLRYHLIDTGAITEPDEYTKMGAYANV